MSHRILVVDDADDVRTLIGMSLTRVGGYDVRAVASGAECLDVLAEYDPEVVVLDVMMPGMDGPATLAAIRAGQAVPDVPVVFLTASVVEADLARLSVLPISGTLSKPFDPLTLPAELAALLDW